MSAIYWLFDMDDPGERWGPFLEAIDQTRKASDLLDNDHRVGFIDIHDSYLDVRTGELGREFIDEQLVLYAEVTR